MWIAEERKRHLGGWLTAFVVMLDKTLMATSFLSVSLFQWPLFPDSNCDRTNPLSAYIVQTAAGTVTASKYTIKRSCYNTVSNSVILRIVKSNLSTVAINRIMHEKCGRPDSNGFQLK